MKKLVAFMMVLLFLMISCLVMVESIDKLDQKKQKQIKSTLGLPGDVLQHSDLPIVVIDTNGEEVHYVRKGESLGESILAEFSLYLPENFKNGDLKAKVEAMVDIGVRGNTSRLLPKKQYSLTLLNKNGDEKETSLLGMPKSAKWILNASFEDQSLLRNKLAYDVSSKIMQYAPRVKFCEVYLVDDNQPLSSQHYKGIYLLVEKIERHDKRINISKTQSASSETSFIVARNRLKLTDILLDNYGFETYLYDYNMVVEYPKTNLTDEKKEYITQTVSEFERVLYSDRFDDPQEGYAAYIDVDSFVDYFIINEFFKNTDAGIFSTYLHKDYGEKIKAGPVWDFDSAMGNSTHLFPYYDETGFYMPQTAWFSELLKDKKFVTQVISRYHQLRLTYLSDDYLIQQIDDYVSELGEAIERNFEKWPVELCNQSEMLKKYYSIIRPYENDVDALLNFFREHPQYTAEVENRANNYDEEIAKLKLFIRERGAWIDKNIDSLLKWAE